MCECCGNKFVNSLHKEQAYCSQSCGAKASIKNRDFESASLKRSIKHKEKNKALMESQAKIYTELESKNRTNSLSKKSGKTLCKESGISFEMGRMQSPFMSF